MSKEPQKAARHSGEPSSLAITWGLR